MKYLISLVLLCTTCQLLAQQQVAYEQNPPEIFAYQQISKEALREDMLFWRKTMEASHVNLYHAIDSNGMTKLIDALLSTVKDSIGKSEAVLLFSKLGAALNEGHIGLVSSRETDKAYTASLRFPFIIKKAVKHGWLVGNDISAANKLVANDTIVSINGQSIASINQQFMALFGGLEVWRYEQIAYNARKLLFLTGIKSPYTIEAHKADGAILQYTVNGFDKVQADSSNRVLAASNQPKRAYDFQLMGNGIGYLNYRSMRNDPQQPFDRFLDSVFTLLQQQKTKGLVIDIRENGGGDSKLGEQLLAYFNQQPYRLASGMKWKISEVYKDYLKRSPNYSEPDSRFYMSQANGGMYTYVNEKLTQPVRRQPFFTGKVAVLIGAGTFSSANMLADGVTSFQLAKTFGEPTGETPNDFGEMFNFMLPNTYIIARGASKMFTRASGNEKDFGAVQPDVVVIPTADAIQQKKDLVLETAVTWLKQQ